MSLALSTRRDGGVVTIIVNGEVDLTTVQNLEDRIAEIAASDATGIVIDLAAVSFLDSAGINALLKGRRLADAHDQSFRVSNPGGIVRRLLDITGVWEHLSGNPS